MAQTRFHPHRVLNPLPGRRVRRKTISRAEQGTVLFVLVALGAAGAWVLSRRDAFDPGERDLSSAQLLAASVEDSLYRAPLRRWSEPSSAAAGVVSGPATAGPDLGLFPRAILDGGWQVDGRVELYEPDTLYEKIDGAAEQYLAFGFRRLHYVTLAKSGAFLTIETYDQTDFPGTLGIFAAQRDPQQPVERQGHAFFYRTPVGAIGMAGNHYFKISGSAGTAEVRAKADALVPLIAGLPGVAEPAGRRAFDILTGGLRVPFDAIAFEKSNVFGYEFLRDTWFARAGNGDARWFLHEVPAGGAAAPLLARLATEHENEYDVVAAGTDRMIYRHKFLKTYFAVARRGSLLFGVDAAPDQATAERLLARIGEALARERS